MRQHLLIDADDTLWENNIYFEQAIHAFIEFLAHSSLTAAEVRAVIDEVERTMGYGSANFTKSLVQTYQRLAERNIGNDDVQYVQRLGEQIARQPIQIMEGVEATLKYLSAQHRLTLLTKGVAEEQQLKVDRSGLADYFEQITIVPEKNTQTYMRLVEDFSLDPLRTWMIGNSPRSDINPALAAGLNAVFIPHPHTWHFEHETIQNGGTGQLLTLKSFAELRVHF
jgi:putative hydrolase of the HAD superfamily